MERARFENYCNKIKQMNEARPDWPGVGSGIIEDYLRERTSFGYAKVLFHLLPHAHAILREHGREAVEDANLYETAGLLLSRAPHEDFRFSAYLFAICVSAVAFCGVGCDAIDCESFDDNELFRYDGTVTMLGETDPASRQLRKYGIRLLDFSRTNQLVHFRPAKSSTMMLYSADIHAFLRHLMKGGTKTKLEGWRHLSVHTVCRCKLCGRLDTNAKYDPTKKQQLDMACPVCDAENRYGRKSMTPLREQVVRADGAGYPCKCGRLITPDEAAVLPLCPDCGERIVPIKSFPVVTDGMLKKYPVGSLLCGVPDIVSSETAKTLMNKAKNMERNFGLHVLYLACGFLNWKDGTGTEYHSPILLCPINMGIDKRQNKYYFEPDLTGGGFEVNRTLMQMLSGYSSTCSIPMPSLAECDIHSYFTLLRETLRNTSEAVAELTAGWEITSDLGIGLFHYQKMQLQHDIEENREKYLAHPVIRRLCGDENISVPNAAQGKRSFEYLMLDADSSQEEVIRAAQEGRSFILQGPPGSGKSQTITNVISSFLGEGKTVLFVAEKASARSVILDNLARASGSYGLTDFVLDFEAFKKRSGAIGRDPFVTELNRCLTPFTPSGGYEDRWLAEESHHRKRVSEFFHQARDEFDGKSYMRLLQSMVPYADAPELHSARRLPTDQVKFTALCEMISRFYDCREACGSPLQYKNDALYGCRGDRGDTLLDTAEEYFDMCREIRSALSVMQKWSWNILPERESFARALEQMRLFSGMPALAREVLSGFGDTSSRELLERIGRRRSQFSDYHEHSGARFAGRIREDAIMGVDLSGYALALHAYRRPLKRLGGTYRALRRQITACLNYNPGKLSYEQLLQTVRSLQEYKDYLLARRAWEGELGQDALCFGNVPDSLDAWDALEEGVKRARDIFHLADTRLLPQEVLAAWLLRFVPETHESTVRELAETVSLLAGALSREQTLHAAILPFFEKDALQSGEYPPLYGPLQRVGGERNRLAKWAALVDALDEIRAVKAESVLEELSTAVADYPRAHRMLYKAFYAKQLAAFVKKHGLTYFRDFTRPAHIRLIEAYAEADRAVRDSSAKRLHEKLKSRLRDAANARGLNAAGEYPKMHSKTGYSVKRTIAENWSYVRAIKPCFMMSPLNVSQYISPDIAFDVVIFDEASQIFTEDALAAISRGKQVIVAGDSKQLPPCDFFRAGESAQDEDEEYFEEETKRDSSLLVAADDALKDSSVSLAWHYRSCDESLIAFANREMAYNLITFPSAKRDPNDGVRYLPVPYDPATCYEAGKGGAHINVGEADAIVELIYREMTDPARAGFSIGVVAFSNAQATEIERRWEEFKNLPANKAAVAAWEKAHEDEPLIFCNLDTVQGDERDTTILSICYSPDAKGRFVLPYLGRIRLLSGKKRINVAVTRAKHQMIVVSTLEPHILRAAIHASTAPEENKAGAEMLLALLEYAETFVSRHEVVAHPSENPFVASVCRVLDEAGISYATEIGRSDCRISIGVYSPGSKSDFCLGIIIDDPARPDFDSVREYTRLTEQVLHQKYGWELYRIFPTSWLENHAEEKKLLLARAREALGA